MLYCLLLFFWANEVLYEYSNDSLGPHYDSLEVCIQQKPGVEAKYELVEHYWRQRRYQDALAYLHNIPTTTKLGKLELVNHSFYEQLKDVLFKAYNDGRTEASLERQEVNSLVSIASRKVGFASVQAGNILQFFYGKGYAYYPLLPSIVSARMMHPNENQVTTEEVAILLEPRLWGYPNPAINWTDIQYQLQDEQTEGTLIITSISGQTIKTITINANTGVLALDTSDWSGGIYFAVLFSNNTKSNVYKLIVRK